MNPLSKKERTENKSQHYEKKEGKVIIMNQKEGGKVYRL